MPGLSNSFLAFFSNREFLLEGVAEKRRDKSTQGAVLSFSFYATCRFRRRGIFPCGSLPSIESGTQKLRRLSGLWLDCLVCKLGDWLWTTNPLANKTKPNSVLVRTSAVAAAVAGGVPFEAGGYMLQAQPLGKSFSGGCPQKAILVKTLLI
jgi:hypothetical protein